MKYFPICLYARHIFKLFNKRIMCPQRVMFYFFENWRVGVLRVGVGLGASYVFCSSDLRNDVGG